jgi:hypothetical protein
MRYYFTIILCFSFYATYAQKAAINNIDSIYYLIDTTKTPVNDRMWKITMNGTFRQYTIQCPCLINNGKPQFFYDIANKDTGVYISQKELKALKLIHLSALILKAKQIESNENKHDYALFLIEAKGKKYFMHEASFINPTIKIVFGPDVVAKKIDTSAFAVKGLIQADSKNLAKYINQTVITSGKVVDTKDNEGDEVGLLTMQGVLPDQSYTIIISKENRNNFDLLIAYRRRWIKVVGKVIKYNGKPAIEINNDKQIMEIHPPQK